MYKIYKTSLCSPIDYAAEELKKYLNQADESKKVSKVNESVPVCPKCQIEMVVRKTRRGMNKGQKFYGCVNYPRCKQTEPFL